MDEEELIFHPYCGRQLKDLQILLNVRHAEDAFIRKQGIAQGIEIGKEQGIEIGKEQGIEIGKEQSLTIFINYMRKNDLSNEQIVEELMTECGLSYEEASEAVH